MAEPGDMNPPLLRAEEPPSEPAQAPAPPTSPAAPPAADARSPWPPVPPAPPARPLAQSQVPAPPAPPVPPTDGGYGAPAAGPQPSHSGSGWRRAFAVLALVAMIAVAGGLLGAASRGSLFTDTSNGSRDTSLGIPSSGSAQPGSGTDDQTSSSPSSGSGGSSSSSAASDVSTALVNINTTLSGGGEGAGTGMIISSSGDVVTNNHVIANATSIHVEIAGDGSDHTAKVIGYDVADDVALIRINNVSGLDTIPIGDPDTVQVNDDIVVVGNALGRGGEPTSTPGTVVALNRQITATDADGSNAETLANMIQVEADVQPGDSGGALVGNDGTVVGMTTAASVNGFRFQQSTAGVGFAIRIDKAIGITQQIKKGDEVDGVHVGGRALLGVSISDESAFGFGGSSGDGALVQSVGSDTPAQDAGIQGGDVIVSIGDETIGSSGDLQDVMNGYHPGDKVSVGWVDASGDTQHATLELIEGPPA